MKGAIATFAFAATAMIAATSYANTLAWFHFDEQEPGFAFTSVGPVSDMNECNNETPVYAYATTGNATVGATPSVYMPRYSTPAYGTQIYDPVSDRKWRNISSMRFTTGTEAGKGGSYYGSTLKVPGTDKSFQPTDAITVECFVCTTGGVFNTFSPIFGKRNSGDYANESWALYMTSNGKLEVRIKAKASGTSGQGSAINDGNWHHVAMTYSKGDGVCRVYVDYAESFTFSPAGGGAISYLDSQEESYTAFHIGGYPFASNNIGRKFNGCIDELRISDVALTPAQFLRFAPPDDPDELVHISFDPHSFYGADIKTTVNYNRRTDVEAKFTDMGGTVSLDGGAKCAAAIRNGIFGDEVKDCGAYSAATNGAGKTGYFKVSALTTKMSGGNVETNISYTIEAFFKTRTTSKAYGPRTLFALGTWPVAGVVLNNTSDGKVCFTYNNKKGWTSAYSDETTANDGAWHHVAVVHDVVRGQMRFYFDRRLSASVNNVDNVLQTGSSLFVGSNTSGANGFDGWIDDVRVMNRALAPHEFLTTHDVGTVDAEDSTVALMDFENGYETSPYPALVGQGTGEKHSTEGFVPVFAERTCTYILDGTNGTDKVVGSKCLKFADSQAYWPYSPIFEQEAFTIEFFGRFSDLVSGAGIIRYAGGVSNIAADPVWALYRDPSKDDLCLRIQLVKDGVSSGNYSAHWLSDAEAKDGRWHHYALTLSPKDGTNTVVELFRDYVSAGAHELPGRLDYTIGKGGRLALGAGGTANKVYGCYDMLRFSRGVLTPDKFMGRVRTGAMLIFR